MTYDNYPPGTYANDPRAPWNQPEPEAPNWKALYDELADELDGELVDVDTRERAVEQLEKIQRIIGKHIYWIKESK